jgi:serine beta-lactamase-like protein LACTB, mitochondrial
MTRVRFRRTVAAALFALCTTAAWAGQSNSLTAVPPLLEAALKLAGAPGLSVAVVVDDHLAWEGAVGLADVENGVAARADTVYRIASISKPIAATAVMQLVERGRVSLDDPVRKYVPFFPDKGGLPLTVRHVLNHTSGIRHYKAGEMESVTRFNSVADAAKIFEEDPLLFTPGKKYSYSTYAYNLLAGVVESASGLSYEAYLNEHIFGPAGMDATRLERAEDIVAHRARQYVKVAGSVQNAHYADLSVKWAGGGVISTAGDLARFHIALDQGKLLKRETLREMYTPARLSDGSTSTYGLGWMISTDAQGRTWVAHSGGATGGTTYLLRNPEAKVAVVVLCNVQNAGNLRKLAMDIAELALAAGKGTN